MYTQKIDGVAVVSNVPFDQSQPAGTFYSVDMNFSNSIVSFIADNALDIASYIDPSLVASQFEQSGHPVTNLRITQPSSGTVNFSFNSTSPQVVEIVAIVFGLFLILFSFTGPLGWIADLLGIVLIAFGGIGLIISSIGVTVQQLQKSIGTVGTVVLIVGGVIVAGVAAVAIARGLKQGG